MKKKEIEELHTKTIEELQRLLLDVKKEILKLAMDVKLGKNKNTSLLLTKRRDVARILTILGEKGRIVSQ